MRRATALVLLAGCRPDLGDRPSQVDRPRIVAVRAEPAEAAPGEAVEVTALVVSSDPTTAPTVRWMVCATPKQLADPAPVSPLCLRSPSTAEGVTTGLTLPADACALFGPEPVVAGARPRDPDSTGGYFVPVRATLADETSFHLQRVACTPRDMTVDLARSFASTYRRNRNPSVWLAPVTLHAGRTVELVASWDSDDAEVYVYFDRATQSLTQRREWMRVSWFSDAGTFDRDHNGRSEDDPSTSVSNGFTPPGAGATVHVWAVLRDARGGVGWVTRTLVVEQ